MASSALVPSYTLDDLEQFPDDGNRYELLDGFLLVTPAPMPSHEWVQSELLRQLTLYCASIALPARLLSHGALEVAPATHAEPDILIIPRTRTAPKLWLAVREWWLVVEISGRGSRIYDRDFKGPAYLQAGVRTYWRVDLRDRCLYVSSPAAPDEVRHDTTVHWTPPDSAAQPFRLDIPALFDGIEGDD
jgi:Uma2 family endonuclease